MSSDDDEGRNFDDEEPVMRGGVVDSFAALYDFAAANLGAEDAPDSEVFPLAAKQNEVGVVKLCLVKGCSPVAHNAAGSTALHEAAQAGHVLVVEVILKSQADAALTVGAVEKTKSSTPLHLAAAQGHAEVIEMILAHGGSKDTLDADGNTPSAVAKTPEIADLFNQ